MHINEALREMDKASGLAPRLESRVEVGQPEPFVNLVVILVSGVSIALSMLNAPGVQCTNRLEHVCRRVVSLLHIDWKQRDTSQAEQSSSCLIVDIRPYCRTGSQSEFGY